MPHKFLYKIKNAKTGDYVRDSKYRPVVYTTKKEMYKAIRNHHQDIKRNPANYYGEMYILKSEFLLNEIDEV